MSRAVFRWLSLVYGWLPGRPASKEALKAFVYTRFGSWFARSPNYAEWLRLRGGAAPGQPEAPPAREPTDEAWAGLRPGERASRPGAGLRGRPYVIVPIYRGRAETLACLYSVCRASPDVRVVAIDDASPDRGLSARLAELAAAGHFELLRNPRNLGFLHSVNRGLALDPEADVVLLNSDTEVYGDWLVRLNAAAHRAPDIGSVTPLSNNGDITSYPQVHRDNRSALELDGPALDALAAEVNRGHTVDTPTGVGFCLYLRRDCLADTGPLDPAFAGGYGEENDLCMRARRAGWRHVIATDVFVRHTGAVSFGERATRLRAEALATLVARHPDYPGAVEDFVRRDPTRPARLRLDLARLRAAQPVLAPRHALLFVAHDWGGGVEQHLVELARGLARERVAVYTLRPVPGGDPSRLALGGPPGAARLPETPTAGDLSLGEGALDEEALGELADALAWLGVEHVHVHHLGELSERGPDRIAALCDALDVPLDVTLHDHAPICPRLHLEDAAGRYCGEPPPEGCGECLTRHGSRFGAPDVVAWRGRWHGLLARARRVVCPSADLRDRMARYWPELPYVVLGHPESGAEDRSPAPAPAPAAASGAEVSADAARLCVLVPGAINEQKGLGLLLACAEDARARALPIDYRVVGYTRDDARAARAGIQVTGPHPPAAADAALEAAVGPRSLALLASLSPETWSYTLSSALRVGLHPVVFDLGALAERVRSIGRGSVLPLALADRPEAVNDALLEIAARVPLALQPRTALPATQYRSLLGEYYDYPRSPRSTPSAPGLRAVGAPGARPPA